MIAARQIHASSALVLLTSRYTYPHAYPPHAYYYYACACGRVTHLYVSQRLPRRQMSPWTRGAAMIYRGLNEFWINHGDHANHITNYGAPLSEELWDYSLYLAPLVKFDDAVRMRAVLDAVLLSHDRQQRNGTDGTDGSEWVDVEEITGRVGERDAATGGEGEGEGGLLDPFIHGRAEPQFVVRTDGSRKSNE